DSAAGLGLLEFPRAASELSPSYGIKEWAVPVRPEPERKHLRHRRVGSCGAGDRVDLEFGCRCAARNSQLRCSGVVLDALARKLLPPGGFIDPRTQPG